MCTCSHAMAQNSPKLLALNSMPGSQRVGWLACVDAEAPQHDLHGLRGPDLFGKGELS